MNTWAILHDMKSRGQVLLGPSVQKAMKFWKNIISPQADSTVSRAKLTAFAVTPNFCMDQRVDQNVLGVIKGTQLSTTLRR